MTTKKTDDNNRRNDTTVTLNAQVAVNSSRERGMSFVQVMPENPRPGLVEPFRGTGYGQLLSNGSFDFVRRARRRCKPALKLPHGSVSFGEDGFDRFTFVLPSALREVFADTLRQEAATASEFMELRDSEKAEDGKRW